MIEILLATTIMAILLACIHEAFFASLRLRQASIESIEAILPVERALQTMQRDLANVITATNGLFLGPLQTTNPTNALPGQIGPDFYTTGGELDGMVPWGNVQKIDYLLAAPTNGETGPGRNLVRAVTHNLLPINQLPMPDEQRILLTGVQSFSFQYYDGTQWDQGWDTTQQTNLPLAIKVQIQMAQKPGPDAMVVRPPLELVVPVDVMLNTNPIVAIQ